MPAARKLARRPPATEVIAEDVVDAEFYAGEDVAIERVAEYLTKVARKPEAEADLEILLHHLGGGAGGALLHAFAMAPGEDIATIAEAIVDRALDEGKTVGHGKMKFSVEVAEKTWGRQAFTLEFPDLAGDELEEAPNEAGISHQQMRHTENIMRQHGGMVEFVVRQIRRDNEELRVRVKELEAEQRANMKVMAELHDTRMVRQIEMQKLERAEARKDEVAGFLVQGVPLIMNKFLGGQYIANASTPLENMLHGLVSSLSQDQFVGMTRTGKLELSQPQVMMFVETIKAMMEKVEAQRRTATPISHEQNGVNGHANGAAHAEPEPPTTQPAPPGEGAPS